MCSFMGGDNCIHALMGRLLEYAQLYYDLSGFPDGETKRALTRVLTKQSRKRSAAGSGVKDGHVSKKPKISDSDVPVKRDSPVSQTKDGGS